MFYCVFFCDSFVVYNMFYFYFCGLCNVLITLGYFGVYIITGVYLYESLSY